MLFSEQLFMEPLSFVGAACLLMGGFNHRDYAL